MSYNRYKRFKSDGRISIVPSIKIPERATDYYEEYKRGRTRLDKVSYDYYNDPNYDWLIMLCNPQYGSMEFEIPDASILRIPYPLEQAIEDYEKQIDNYKILYGI